MNHELRNISYLCTRKRNKSNNFRYMINSQDIKKGTAIRMDGGIWVCIDFQHRKPGKGNTIMIIKVKNVSDGRVLERRFNIGEKLEDVIIERRPYQYLYEDQSGRIFMNQETFEQIPIDNELVIGHEYIYTQCTLLFARYSFCSFCQPKSLGSLQSHLRSNILMF